jgi:dTDP-4-dehydrorhamnose reductase
MKKADSPKILVLGANGMLGHTVFRYLNNFYETFGTVKDNPPDDSLLTFDAHDYTKLNKILKDKNITYIINCIAVLQNNPNEKEMKYVNAEFPHKLTAIVENNHVKLIHISTDAVFDHAMKKVTEEDIPTPTDIYGKTKLQGEPLSDNAITIRTSLIGLDPKNHKGLLESVLQEKEVTGYINQLWSGATTLQLAKLCHLIVSNGSYQSMRRKSHIFHFAPVQQISKYAIIKAFFEVIKYNKNVKKSIDKPLSRQLITKYPDLLYLAQVHEDLKKAIEELAKFEQHTYV